jgi:hypothetical protein
MSKIFEALQYAQIERLQRDEMARRTPEPQKENRVLKAERAARPEKATKTIQQRADSCSCRQHSARVARQGVIDFLCRLAGAYPWQCLLCSRRFHRLRRL